MLNTLQAGRGLAAIAVLLFHLNIGAEAMTGLDIIPGASKFGHRGVDFFFVLSGFIMMLAHQDDIGRPERWSRFAYKRFVRIYPVYWIYTAVVLVTLLIGMGHAERVPQNFPDWFSTITLVRVSDVVTPIGPGWTLFNEVMFYAMFSVLMLDRRAGVIVMAAWFGACTFIGAWPPSNVYSPYTTAISALNLDFLMGIGAFLVSQRIRSVSLAAAAVVAGLAVLILAAVVDVNGFANAGYVYGLGFATLIAGATNLERRRPINLPIMMFLGNASYSIYLVHETGLAASSRALSKIGVTDPYVMVTLAGAASLAAGLAAYLLVEKPLMKWMRRKRTDRSQTMGPEAQRG